MKKLLALLLALVMVFALCACGSSTETPAPAATPAEAPADDTPAAEPIHIMFGHDNLPGEPLTEAAEYWAEELEKVSGGTMILDVYDSSTAGTKNDLLDQLQAGDLPFRHAHGENRVSVELSHYPPSSLLF